MVIANQDEEGLKKLAKFKPKPPKDIGERPVDPKKAAKKKTTKKKKDDDGDTDGQDFEPDAKKAKA